MAAEPAEGDSSLVSFGRRLSRHAGVYASGSVATFVFSLVNLAVLTRLLPIEEFGRFAVYLMLATLLTTVYNLGSLQGTLSWVFGASDVEEGVVTEEDGGAYDKERALTTGVLLTVGIAMAGTLVVFAAAPLFAELIHTPGQVEAVRLAALCGATGAVWRLVHNVMRLERRPTAYTTLGLVRPALVLGLGVAFVISGHGVEGALAGIALGTALAIPAALASSWRSYALGFEWGAVTAILGRGVRIVPFILTIWIITNVDLYLVNTFSPPDSVGPYRVAMRLGGGVSYLVSAVTMAWLPLTRVPLHAAVNERHGKGSLGGTLLTPFLLVCIWAILGLTLLSDVLIGIAPGSYASAAPFVPLIGLGVVSSGVLLVIYRGSSFPKRRSYYIKLLLLATAVFLGAGLILVPRYGGFGAAAAQVVAFSMAAAIMLWLDQRSQNPMPIQYGRLARGIVVGLLCIAFGQLVSPLAGDARIAVDLAILAGFPALLILVHAFPSEDLKTFVKLSRPSTRRRPSPAIVEKLKGLDSTDRKIVAALTPREGSPLVAGAIADGDLDAMKRFVVSLRAMGPPLISAAGRNGSDGYAENGEDPDENGKEAAEEVDRDPEIAAYLLTDSGVATRDALGKELRENGVDPLELDVLDVTLGNLRRLPRSEWERLRR